MVCNFFHIYFSNPRSFTDHSNLFLPALVAGWMSLFLMKFNTEMIAVSFEMPWTKNASIFEQKKPHEILREITNWRYFSSIVGCFICIFLFPLNPLWMLRISAFPTLLIGICYIIPYWTGEHGLPWFCLGRVFMGFSTALGTTAAVTFLSCANSPLPSEHHHRLLGSLIAMGVLGEIAGLMIAYKTVETEWMYFMLGLSVSVIIPWSLTWLPNISRYGQDLNETSPNEENENLDDSSTTFTQFLHHYFIHYSSFIKNHLWNKKFPIRALLAAWFNVMCGLCGNLWKFNILCEELFHVKHIEEENVLIIGGCISVLAAFASFLAFKDTVEAWRKLLFCASFNMVLAVAASQTIVNVSDTFFIVICVAHIVFSAVATELMFEMLPTLFTNNELRVGWPFCIFLYYVFNEGVRLTVQWFHVFNGFWLSFLLAAFSQFLLIVSLCVLHEFECLRWILVEQVEHGDHQNVSQGHQVNDVEAERRNSSTDSINMTHC